MSKKPSVEDHRETFRHLQEVAAQALEHWKLARQFHRERRDIISGLIDAGFSQADIARELGVTRQAIQKQLSL
ncbi:MULTISPECIES: hypothetical protein [unclassified Nocardioides]|uniref:hypothetical protein n=1 Tax=unclassified Nocardioides TaxID=2615069 RepID=UPI0009F0BBFF|nr:MULTISPECIES: hypothetical protein [unclassified Nocardioides]GAW48031.1 RNA polymerase sigma factor, sigma-70 family [Nocardioides sp. PD653-B2]GAW53666.1 RNA polymerase sigma factor, sigma-70 family [Nocardioides sp. PD653]